MEDSKPSEQATGWRQHMRELPNAEPPFPAWMRWFFIGPALVISGIVLVIFGGVFLGMALGVGPEDTGGVVWLVCGFVPAFAFGGLLALFGRRRGYSRASCRAAFYLFTTPAWLFMLYFAWKLAAHVL